MNSAEAFDLIETIAATSSRTEKERLVLEGLQDELFKQSLGLAYDSFITFGITPPKVKTFGTQTFTTTTPQPWIMLYQLSKRELTGTAAATAVKRMLEDLEPKSSELLRRILAKDLRAGFTKNTVNRALPGTITTFEVMLSKPFEEKRIKSWPVAVEPKLDGLRAMGLVRPDGAKFFSRVGNHFPALDHLSDVVVQTVKNAIAAVAELSRQPDDKLAEVYFRMLGGDTANPTLALDCEAISGGFNKTTGDVRRKSEDASDIVLNVFDAIPYRIITSNATEINIPFRLRRKFAEFVVGCAPAGAPIVMTPLRLAHSADEIMEIYQAHREAGLEGAMVKLLDGPYQKKKGHLWMKIKAEETEDLRITGWFEGKQHTKLEGKFGGFLVDRINSADGKVVQVRVGGGFSDELRALFETWCRNDDAASVGSEMSAIGRLIEVEYHEVTPDGSLRHPRFVRFRDDKDEVLRSAA